MVVRRASVWSLVGLLLVSSLFGPFASPAALAANGSGVPEMVSNDRNDLVYLRRGEEAVETFVAAPAALDYLRRQTATINVEYVNFPDEARASFQSAVEIWQSLITSSVPITVVASWQPLGSDILGGAAAVRTFRNFEGAPQRDTYYPSALANKLAGVDLAPGEADIRAVFNSNVSDWYYGTGQTPRNQLNFVSTVIHELGHGIGFSGSASVSEGTGQWGNQGLPRVYDRNVVNGAGTSIIDTSQFPNPSVALAQQLQSNNLFWSGAGGVAAGNGTRPRLYAPMNWQQGSSYSHLDERAYPAGTANSLMTPALASGETVYDPGPIALGMLADMGWTIGNEACFPETGKCVKGRFLQYWTANGGLAQQGYPLTGEFDEVNPTNGKTYKTQYFERARFEYHPENNRPYDVLLGLLGREQFLAKYGGAAPPAMTDNPLGEECATFEQTGKRVCGLFLTYWRQNGGLAQQGFPLTDLFMETNPTDGKQYPTQYFERARFEYHAELAGTPYVVLLGLLGREQFLAKYPNGIPGPQSPLPNARLSVTPDQGPNGTHFVVTGTGFAPDTTYYLQVARGDGSDPLNFSDPALKSNIAGIFSRSFQFGPNAPQGTYVARIASAPTGGTIFASANFTLTGPNGQPTGPRLSVTPPEEQPNSRIFVATSTGLTPNAGYTLRVQTEDRQTTVALDNPNGTADANGTLQIHFGMGYDRPAGRYIAEIISTGSSPQVVAGAIFRLVGPAPPPSASPSPSAPGAWGPTLAPLAGGQVYAHASGKFTVSLPNTWEVIDEADSVVIVGVENPDAICLVGVGTVPVGGTLADLDRTLDEINSQLDNYQQVSKDRVLVRGQQAYRRVISYTLETGTTMREEQVYFLAGHLYTVMYCITTPQDFAGFAPTFDGIGGSIKLSTMALVPDPTTTSEGAFLEAIRRADFRAQIAQRFGEDSTP
jgi:hypothetical protein